MSIYLLIEFFAICRMLATQALQGAMASDTYVCGMQPLDQDHPLYNVFVCNSQLTCHQVVEPTFYSSGNKHRKTYDGDADVIVEPMLCAVCAGMSMDPDGAFIDDKLAAVFHTLLPICQTCLNNNGKYYARGYQKNGKQMLRALELERRRRATISSQPPAE